MAHTAAASVWKHLSRKWYGREWETGRDAEGWEHVWRAVKANKCATLWRRKTDIDKEFNRADGPEFDPSDELDTQWRGWLQTDCKVIQHSSYDRGRASSEEKKKLSFLSIHLV